jgi:hypothetical protein
MHGLLYAKAIFVVSNMVQVKSTVAFHRTHRLKFCVGRNKAVENDAEHVKLIQLNAVKVASVWQEWPRAEVRTNCQSIATCFRKVCCPEAVLSAVWGQRRCCSPSRGILALCWISVSFHACWVARGANESAPASNLWSV